MTTRTPTMNRRGAADVADDSGASPADDQPPESEHADAAVEVVLPQGGGAGATADGQWLSGRLIAALEHIRRPVARITVGIHDDHAMLALNQAHRGVADTTDVLSFELSGPGDPIEADIAVCADEAERRAARMGHTIRQELLLYALHGVLHCAGFDDETAEGFEAMHAEEDRILTAIGVGPIFARDRSGRDEKSPARAGDGGPRR